MSGYGYNYDGNGGQYQDESRDPYHQGQQYQYGYHDPYSSGMDGYGDVGEGVPGISGYGDYGYGEPVDDPDMLGMNGGIPVQGGDVGDGENNSSVSDAVDDEIDFDDPRIANLPRILLMGPRRAGKTSIQVSIHILHMHDE